jgi:Spy/CpxP family protein refolding chaperone
MNRIASRFALLGLALSVVSFAPTVFAQDTPAPASADNASQHRAPDPQRQAARLAKRLGLSDDQAAKITSILQNRQQQMAGLRGDSSLAAQDRHAKMRSIQQDTDTQINAVLTPDQQKQYATMKQNTMERRQNARGAANSGDSDSDSH